MSEKTEKVMQAIIVLPDGQAVGHEVPYPPPKTLPLTNKTSGQDDTFVFDCFVENVTTGHRFARYKKSALEVGTAVPGK